MGDCFQKLGDLDATAEEALGLADSVTAWLVAEEIVSSELTDCGFSGLGRRPGRRSGGALADPDHADGLWTRLSTNGLRIDVERQVYFGGQGGVSDAACPNCGNIARFGDFSDAYDDWVKDGVADHACPACTQSSLTNDWILEPQWGVGHLQLTFWNWPPLSKQFRDDVSAHLNHHRLLDIYDKF